MVTALIFEAKFVIFCAFLTKNYPFWLDIMGLFWHNIPISLTKRDFLYRRKSHTKVKSLGYCLKDFVVKGHGPRQRALLELGTRNMIQISISLPKLYRSARRMARPSREVTHVENILPTIDEIKNVRSGSRISRVFSHIFSHKSIKAIFGANIAFGIVAASFLPVKANFEGEFQQNVISPKVIMLTTEKGVRNPVNGVKITQGYRIYHPGLDLDGVTGDPVYPIMNGKVEAIQRSKFAYGNAVLINHGSGLTSLYAHLSKILVKVGAEVNTKEVIGLMGSTGRSSGDHLHLEVRDDGRPINPYTILPR